MRSVAARPTVLLVTRMIMIRRGVKLTYSLVTPSRHTFDFFPALVPMKDT